MKVLTANTARDFRAWADNSRALWGVDVVSDDDTFAVVADASGVAWRIEDVELVQFAVEVAAGRQLWAWDAATTGRLLTAWTGVRLPQLCDAATLHTSLRADGGFGHPTDADADASACARLVAELARTTPEEERGLARQNVRAQQLWDAAAARGYRVNTALLAQLRAQIAQERSEGIARFGLDLTADSDEVRRWVAAQGIELAAADGRASLSHKKFHLAEVPDHARDAWAAFCELRAASSPEGKLTEVAGAVREGRVFPTIRAVGARTGRMSISGPALQNLPSRMHSLRPLLLADTGMTLVACDLDHVEPSIAAALSGDPGLLAAVAPGEDVYLELASRIWGECVGQGDERRGVAKVAFLAQLYGQSTGELAADLRVSVVTAQSVVTGLRREYPILMEWLDELRSAHRAGRRVLTGHGRECARYGVPVHAIANHVIQGTAADEFKAATIRVHESLAACGIPDGLWLPVHDELVVQVEVGREADAMEALREGMTSDFRGVTLSGTPTVLGPSWGKA